MVLNLYTQYPFDEYNRGQLIFTENKIWLATQSFALLFLTGKKAIRLDNL
jgi:hypothetical protein